MYGNPGEGQAIEGMKTRREQVAASAYGNHSVFVLRLPEKLDIGPESLDWYEGNGLLHRSVLSRNI